MPLEIVMKIMSINLYPKYSKLYWWVVGYLSNFHPNLPLAPLRPSGRYYPRPPVAANPRRGRSCRFCIEHATCQQSPTIAVETIKACPSINCCVLRTFLEEMCSISEVNWIGVWFFSDSIVNCHLLLKFECTTFYNGVFYSFFERKCWTLVSECF